MKKFPSASFPLLVFMYVLAVYLLPFHCCICLRMFAGYNFDFSTSGFYLVE